MVISARAQDRDKNANSSTGSRLYRDPGRAQSPHPAPMHCSLQLCTVVYNTLNMVYWPGHKVKLYMLQVHSSFPSLNVEMYVLGRPRPYAL